MDERTPAFLGALYRGASFGNYFRLADRRVEWFPTSNIPPCTLGDTNIYISVHGCKQARDEYERTRVEDVAILNCLFCEWDTKDFENDAATRSHILALKVQPQVIVFSGGGYHGYWFIDEPMSVTPDDLKYLAPTQAAWVKLCGGDPCAKDLARVLRLPDTWNAKYTPHRKVSFVRFDLLTQPPYKLVDLCAMAEPFWDTSPAPAANTPTIEHGKKSGAIAGIVNTLRTAPEGKRNDVLLWAACRLYEQGMSGAGVQSELLPIAVGIGLTEKESLATIRSAAKQPARPPEPYIPHYIGMPTRSKSSDEAIASTMRKYQS